MVLRLSVFVILLFGSLVRADQIIFDKILVEGNSKTSEKVILNELGFTTGQALNEEDIQKGIARLRNTNLFTKVSHNVVDVDGKKHFVVEIGEKWTTIPIFKLASGGGVSHITLGVYNPNLFGQYVESGAQYERLEDTNSAVLWFKNPRLFGKRQGIDVQYWNLNRLRTKYFQGPEEPEILTGFLHKRQKIYLGYTRELMERLNAKAFLEHNEDEFTDDFTNDEVKARLALTGLPPDTTYNFLGVGLDYGQVNVNSFRLDGSSLSFEYRYGLSDTEDLDDFWQADLSYRYYKTILKQSTVAQRLMGGFTSTDALQYWYYLGGLDRVRGFSDNRFAGRYFALSNSEFRHPVWRNKHAVVQGVTFLDLVAASEEFHTLDILDGASVGAGLRVILPKVYRFVVRMDFAQPIKREDDMNFSFGVQQFF